MRGLMVSWTMPESDVVASVMDGSEKVEEELAKEIEEKVEDVEKVEKEKKTEDVVEETKEEKK